MKLKLIAVCIIALLVLTVAPMAVTAKPVAKTTTNDQVYAFDSQNPYVLGHHAGKITFDTVTGAYSCICNGKLAPDTLYYICVARVSPTSTTVLELFSVRTDANGHLNAVGTFNLYEYQLHDVNMYLSTGGVFVVCTPW